MSSKTITACQSCGSTNLILRFNAGFLPSVNVMQPIGQRLSGQNFYPAELLECQECKLVQLGCIVDQEEVFPPDYAYTSGSTRLLRENFADLAKEAQDFLGGWDDLVVDIGGNDGTNMEAFRIMNPKQRVMIVEPTDTAYIAAGKGIPVRKVFFGKSEAMKMLGEYGFAKLITCCNCFAHMPDINGVMDGVHHLLADDGVFITESHYLGSVLDGQWDTIYHEHLRYYSLTSLRNLLDRHGFAIINVKNITTHGGSIRVTAMKKDAALEGSAVDKFIVENEDNFFKVWETFRRKSQSSKIEMFKAIMGIQQWEWDKGRRDPFRIYGIGAPSRATTYIHYCGLDETILDCVCEIKGSNKIGKYIPGTAIPVVDEEKLYQDQPEYALLLSWHLADELIPKIREKGFKGQFIQPLPEVKVIN